jgi:hypothetical protein
VTAALADLCAGQHFTAADPFAGNGAGVADIGTGQTGCHMQVRSAHQEVGASLAHLDAVGHDFYMVWRGVTSAHLKTMIVEVCLAGVATLPAQFDAGPERFRIVMH